MSLFSGLISIKIVADAIDVIDTYTTYLETGTIDVVTKYKRYTFGSIDVI